MEERRRQQLPAFFIYFFFLTELIKQGSATLHVQLLCLISSFPITYIEGKHWG